MFLPRFLVNFYNAFELLKMDSGFEFNRFCERYYRYWIHSGQVVTLQDHNTHAKIIGITSEGFLETIPVERDENGSWRENGGVVELMPGGNSFDLLKGLICTKK